ncbi:MAG: hypothetical protein WHS44_11680 [Fimbriimonadales bacterium]|nr:MAG: hypothetical protein KatS3mg018_2406 [Fimbriimonadales bacterium]
MKRSRTQADQVAEVMRALGGYATLAELYQKIPVQQWGTKTPFATIRRILQTDRQQRFFRIRPGLWGLTDRQDEILRQLGIGAQEPPETVIEFNHAYYQGLALQIGQLRNHLVFAPKSDWKKPFLKGTLRDLITVDDVPPFTYEELCNRARTVDVVWFQQRPAGLFPYAFFEIEHTTDFQNSLLKFADFQDFRIRFFVVASVAREPEFRKRIRAVAFDGIRDWVKFVDYETLGRLYEREVYAQKAGI